MPIRLGDTDLDGFPDLLFVAATSEGHTPKLLVSEPCTRGLAGCDANGRGRRGFRLVRKGTESLEAIKDARGVTLLDLDEDVRIYCFGFFVCSDHVGQGTLDVLVQRTGTQGEGTISFIHNNFYYDAFFLKAIGTFLEVCCNVCADDCSSQWRV